MGFYMRAVHRRNPGKHCVNLLFYPDAECRAFFLNEEQGARSGWMDGWVRERQNEAKRRCNGETQPPVRYCEKQ